MHLFLHNSGLLNANQLDDVLYIVPFTFKFEKNGCQKHIFSLFFRQINAQFLVSACFRVDTFMSHVFYHLYNQLLKVKYV